MRLCSHLTGKRKPRPGLGVAAISPKQPAARRRRWRQAHFGPTGLKGVPYPNLPPPCSSLSLPVVKVVYGEDYRIESGIQLAEVERARSLGWWAQNAPAYSACGAQRAVLGRQALPLTPAAVCASWSGEQQTAIGPILTKTPLLKTAA